MNIMIKEIVFTTIVKPIISHVLKLAENKGSNILKTFSQEHFQKQFIENAQNDILTKYGDEKFYNDLSKLICKNAVLDSIYQKCYQADYNDYRTNKEFIDQLMLCENFCTYDQSIIKNAISYILDNTFKILNQPEYNDTRKIMNCLVGIRNIAFENLDEIKNIVTKTQQEVNEMHSCLSSTNIENANTLQSMNNEYVLNPILQFMIKNHNDYEIHLNSINGKPLFTVSLTVKYAGTISKFQTAQQFLSYLSFTGKSGSLEVVEIWVNNEVTEETFCYYKKQYDGPVCKLNDFEVASVSQLPDKENLSQENIIISVQPPIDTQFVTVENEDGEILIDNLRQGIFRQPQINGDLKVTLRDLREGISVTSDFINIFHNNMIISSSIHLENNNSRTVSGWISYFSLLKRLRLSENLIFRDKKTGQFYGKCSGINSDMSLDQIDNALALYKKLQKIQDENSIIFSMPQQFNDGNVTNINMLYDLYTKGDSKIDVSISIKKSQIVKEGSWNKENKFILSSTLKYICLFDVKIDLIDSYLVMPQAKLKEETSDQFVFDTDLQTIVVSAEKLGSSNTFDYAIKYMNEQRLTDKQTNPALNT